MLALYVGDSCTTGRFNRTFLNAWFYQVWISPHCFNTLWANYSYDSYFPDKETDKHKNQATCPAPTIIVVHRNSHTIRTAEPWKVIQCHPFLWRLGNWSLLVKEPAPKSWPTVKLGASGQAGLHQLCEYCKSILKYNLMAPRQSRAEQSLGKHPAWSVFADIPTQWPHKQLPPESKLIYPGKNDILSCHPAYHGTSKARVNYPF